MRIISALVVAVAAVAVLTVAQRPQTTQKPKYLYTKKPLPHRELPQITLHAAPLTTKALRAETTRARPRPPATTTTDSPAYPSDVFPDYYTENTGAPGGGHDNYTLDYNECYFNFCECCPPERGPRGAKGDRGLPGASGEKGAQGQRGFPGQPNLSSMGLKGDTGDKGPTGNTGPAGTPGFPGKPGEKGDVGSKGERGETGYGGVNGDRGEKGDTGQNGTAGDRGEPGRPGPTGPPGLAGEPGLKGDRGDKGDCGTLGERGLKGEIGDSGPPGMPGGVGPPGVNGKFGPQGAAGVRGDPGPPGPHGEPGMRGAQGAHGMRGMFGPKGDRGPPGMRGDRGPRGMKGAKGGGTAVLPKRSAFSVGLTPSKSFPPSGFPVRFDKVFYNNEGHYNVSSSSFTVVHAGVYVFSFHITVRNKPLRAALVVNGARRVRMRDSLYGQDIDQASTLVLLGLAAGDEVWLETLRDWNGAYASSEDDSLFSGFLLYSDKP